MRAMSDAPRTDQAHGHLGLQELLRHARAARGEPQLLGLEVQQREDPLDAGVREPGRVQGGGNVPSEIVQIGVASPARRRRGLRSAREPRPWRAITAWPRFKAPSSNDSIVEPSSLSKNNSARARRARCAADELSCTTMGFSFCFFFLGRTKNRGTLSNSLVSRSLGRS